jgi:tol-pal system protein YbgF
MTRNRILILLALTLGIINITTGNAQAPVIDLSRASSQDAPANAGLEVDQEENSPTAIRMAQRSQNEPMDQRVLRLERQVSSLIEFNYTSKLEKMQQDLQQLHGQIEVQNHDLIQLKEQVKSFYQDLDQRVTKLQPNINTPQDKTQLTAEKLKKTDEDSNPINYTSKSKELQTYETAFNQLNKKEYDKAISSFQNFIKNYPSSSYTINAHYWLGEIYYLKGKPAQASREFQIIVTNYPDNPKVADAMLKLALISMDAGNYVKAKQQLTKVQRQFPSSTAAKIAALRLKEIKQK